MAVTVVKEVNIDGDPQYADVFETGNYFSVVNDGHLAVSTMQGGNTVATFAPGQWLSAYVNDALTTKKGATEILGKG